MSTASEHTYRVVVTREDTAWLADVGELDRAHTYARTLRALDKAVREVIVLAADLPDEAMGELVLDYDFSAVAREQGVSQDAALVRLIDEHEMNQVHAGYAQLRGNAAEWDDYTRELATLDNTAGDGLGDARAEYPEQNR